MSAGLTDTWSGIKSSYGAGGGNAIQGGFTTALGAGLGTLMGNPLAGILLTQLGTSLLGKLFGGSSGSDQMINQMSGIGKTLIPQLQQQAAGMPTAATRAMGNQLNQQVVRGMQSSGASASRSMPGGAQVGQATPARVAQNRLQGARIEGMANIMGQSQAQAQQQLQQLFGMGVGAQQQLEASEAASRARVSQSLAQIYAMAKNPELATGAYTKQAVSILQNLILQSTGMAPPTGIGNTNTTISQPDNFWDALTQGFRGQKPTATGNTATSISKTSLPQWNPQKTNVWQR